MTLAGRHVVVCRATRQSGPLLDAIDRAGGIAVHVPLIEVMPPEDGGDGLRRALEVADQDTWLAVTSANGIDAVAAAAAGLEKPWHLGVVGRATSARAVDRGLVVDFRSPEVSADGLGRTLPVDAGQRVVAAVAELASDDLSAALRHRGIEVDVVTAYRTTAPEISPDDIDRIRSADLVLVTAPSVVERLLERLAPAELPAMVAIGASTAAAIRARGLTVGATADEPSTGGLIAAAVRTLAP